MLRHKLGEGVFWEGIRTYYSKFQNANAMTDDFRKVMEEVSGTNLKAFFDQWLLIKGQPEIKWDWTYRNGKIDIAIDQIQDHYTFQFPLEIGIVCNGQLKINTLQIDKKSTSFTIPAASSPDALVLDPESWLLFEEKK